MKEHKIRPPMEDKLVAPYITTDRDVDAGYIAFTNNPVAETVEVHPSVLLDLDADGGLIGIEILDDVFVDLMEQIAGEREMRDSRGRASEAN